jgi:N-methylhydantoinase A
MAHRIGVDIGGTFTDVVLLDLATGRLLAAKAPTDYGDPVGGILAAFRLARAALAEAGSAPAAPAIEALNHATTLATNALLQGKLPKGALVTTQGFRDVLDIGRIQRPQEAIYDMNIDNPLPMIPRHRRLEAVERLGAHGDVVTPLDEAALRRTLAALKGEGVEAVAIAFLFSFLDPRHERRAAEIVAEEMPGVAVSVSSAISPELREYERSSTAVIDAVLKPIMAPYLGRLAGRLAAEGIPKTRIMLASGGLTSPDLAALQPVKMVNSGPSAGVIASANLGRRMGLDALATIDMGGTSLDIGIVEQGRPVHRYEGKIAGYPFRIPMIDVAAVAAGGGSIAHVDALNYIQVSRESAGSTPGPACYGRGGTHPTITDADLALGRIGQVFGGTGGFRLDPALARAAIARGIGARLGIDTDEAAAAMLRIVQARMVKAISQNTLEKGWDVRRLPLLVYGGAGPTHGVELADAMSMDTAILPYLAGNFSATGLLIAPLRWDESRMVMQDTEAMTPALVDGLIAEMDAAARKRLAEAGADPAALTTRWLMHMRYFDQAYDVPVDLGDEWRGTVGPDIARRLAEAFDDIHFRRYAYRGQGEAVECVQLRVSVAGAEIDYPEPAPAAGPAERLGRRRVFFTGESAWFDAETWAWATLPPGHAIVGPAVVEGEGSSALVPPGWRAELDRFRSLVVRRIGA